MLVSSVKNMVTSPPNIVEPMIEPMVDPMVIVINEVDSTAIVVNGKGIIDYDHFYIEFEPEDDFGAGGDEVWNWSHVRLD